MKTFKFKSRWGDEYEIRFVKTQYAMDGNLAILAENLEPEFGWWEPYGNLTVNLGDDLNGWMGYLDTNNVPDLCDFAIEKGWCTVVGYERSGFCTYPLAVFTAEFLEEICEEEA